MKKILMIILTALTAVACLDQGSFSQAYTADVTFEYSDNVYKESFRDSVYVMSEGDAFLCGQFPIFFSQKYKDGAVEGGFMLSCLKGGKNGEVTTEFKKNDEWRVNAPSGNLGSKTYVVFYDNPDELRMPKHDVEFGYKSSGYMTPSACYVNNTTLVARKINEFFKDGDKLTLKAIGVTPTGTTVETSITLAEFTAARDSIMYNWTQFPLSSLGSVDYVDFEVESTNPNVPGYFCMDNFIAGVQIEY